MTAFTSANWTGSGAITSATVDISSDWITNDGGALDGKTGIDSYGYQTYIHEIGHALASAIRVRIMAAPSIPPTRSMPTTPGNTRSCRISRRTTIPDSSYRYVVTPQMADIYAVGFDLWRSHDADR